MRKIAIVIVLLLVAAAAVGGLFWWHAQQARARSELVLYGNVDLRQVELAFNNSERIVAVLAQEGDHVQQGQVLARLDTSRLLPKVEQAEAQAASRRQVVERLRSGNRPEEIAQARRILMRSEKLSIGCTTAAAPRKLRRPEPTSNPPGPTQSIRGELTSEINRCLGIGRFRNRMWTTLRPHWTLPKPNWLSTRRRWN